MRKINPVLAACLLIVAIIVNSCGSMKPEGKSLKLPCDKDAKPERKYFKGYGTSDGKTVSVARQKAFLDAKRDVAARINSTIKSVTDEYTNDITIGDANEFETKFENLTREVVNQELNNIERICDETTILKDGTHKHYVAIRIDKEQLLENISSKIASQQKLKLDYDKAKFEEKFNSEMEKMEEQGYY